MHKLSDRIMEWKKIEEGEKLKRLKATLLRIENLPVSDMFREFRLDNKDVLVSMKEFYEFVMSKRGELGL